VDFQAWLFFWLQSLITVDRGGTICKNLFRGGAMIETKKTCPRCSSQLIIRLGNADHCNACSLDFNLEKNPIAARAQEQAKPGAVPSEAAERRR